MINWLFTRLKMVYLHNIIEWHINNGAIDFEQM